MSADRINLIAKIVADVRNKYSGLDDIRDDVWREMLLWYHKHKDDSDSPSVRLSLPAVCIETAERIINSNIFDGQMYLIWSNEHNSWWCPDHSGYTSIIVNAGRYTLSDAIAICNGANYSWNTDSLRKIPNELPIPEEAALMLEYKNRPIKRG